MNAKRNGLFAAILAALVATSAAFAITITPATTTVAFGDQNSQSQIDGAIAPFLGTSTLLYKQDVGGPESGSLAGSYQTVFANTPGDPADATITYVGGPIVDPVAFLLVKDGNMSPAWYLFNLSGLGWTGTQTLELTGFWPDQGAISHVSLYGGSVEQTPGVPDGGSSVAMLGLGLCGVAWLRRRLGR